MHGRSTHRQEQEGFNAGLICLAFFIIGQFPFAFAGGGELAYFFPMSGESKVKDANPERNKEGFILLSRGLLSSPTWAMRDKDFRLWLYCLMRANWEDQDWWDGKQRINIKRGQFVTGLFTLARETKLSVKNIRTSLQNLKMIGNLAIIPTSRYSLITIINYDEFQRIDTYLASKVASGRQAVGKRSATNKEYKALKEEEYIVPTGTEPSLGSNLEAKNLPPRKVAFSPPSLAEVSEYCKERGNSVDPEHFINYYEARGWKLKGNKMASWKSAVITWEKNDLNSSSPKSKHHESEYA